MKIGRIMQKTMIAAATVFCVSGILPHPLPVLAAVEAVPIYRLYNPNTGEHLYTKNVEERAWLSNYGWRSEGIAWYGAKDGDPVFRVYNPSNGDHHYTTDIIEKDYLTTHGWEDEGTAWYSQTSSGVPIYRAFNPNETIGTHNYTRSEQEQEWITTHGWNDEGVCWYGTYISRNAIAIDLEEQMKSLLEDFQMNDYTETSLENTPSAAACKAADFIKELGITNGTFYFYNNQIFGDRPQEACLTLTGEKNGAVVTVEWGALDGPAIRLQLDRTRKSQTGGYNCEDLWITTGNLKDGQFADSLCTDYFYTTAIVSMPATAVNEHLYRGYCDEEGRFDGQTQFAARIKDGPVLTSTLGFEHGEITEHLGLEGNYMVMAKNEDGFRIYYYADYPYGFQYGIRIRS